LPDLFQDAYPLARRAARAQSATWSRVLRGAGLDREDLEAACIAEVWLNLARFNPMKASLRAFVERVVATKAISILRRCRARKRTWVLAESTCVSRMPVEAAIARLVDVRRALAFLNDADQKIAKMLLHWKPSEIGKIYGISRAAVYRSKERIRAVLRKFDLDKC
jgi:RNA polymerase sigma factor (sigma-70 family)